MKKRILAVAITVCLLFTALTCVANAATGVSAGEIISEKRICPGKTLNLEEPEVNGFAAYQGWEIQTSDGVWVPYDGYALSESDSGKLVRYFVATAAGEYSYSETEDGEPSYCLITVKHNPTGSYKYDGMSHWRDCADCGGQADKEAHTTLGSDATEGDKTCTVCGQRRTSQYTGIIAFWNWLMTLIMSFL